MSTSLECCCCGGSAGRFEQHWNRDSGYGICGSCVAEECARSTPEEIQMRYGQVDVNYAQPRVQHHGRRFKVLATTTSQARANAFIERTPGASVLCVLYDGTIVLADARDEGEPVQAPAEQAA